MRVSGKDLIKNHLTMSLYNHAAIFNGRSDRMPQSFYTNGHVLVDGEKMSKSAGNFVTLVDGVATWTADGCRMALAVAGQCRGVTVVLLHVTCDHVWRALAVGSVPRHGGGAARCFLQATRSTTPTSSERPQTR
jgi:valyl-tRNA synthetase